MTNQRFEELFNKAYEGGSLDSTEAVELVDELDRMYRLNRKLKMRIYELERQVPRKDKDIGVGVYA